MNLIFKDPETLQRMREGPLGPYVDSYEIGRAHV